MPKSLLGREGELWRALMRSLELNDQAPRTYLHGDVHIGNLYITGAGKMGLCDWQCTVKGQWARDFAYTVTATLTTEDRRNWERELLAFYLDRLQAAGGDAPGPDAAWLAYRQQVFHSFYAWVYTIGAGAMQPAMQLESVCLAMIGRMGTAIEDLESLKSLSE